MAHDAEIIVIGSVHASPETIDELLDASLVHVHRSRTEPGCLAHGVSRDVEDPNLLLFSERWKDRGSLDQHFAVPASGEFVAAVRRLGVGSPTMTIYAVHEST
jgi:quinol monooxygenase YgiN